MPDKFDSASKQKRYEEEARQIMNSIPIGARARKDKNVALLDCNFVSESFADNFVVAQNSKVTKIWCFKNTGK